MTDCYNLQCNIEKKIYKVIYFSVTNTFSSINYTQLLGEIDNLNKETAIILEIETPIDKDDLVRFKDEYGRENKPYENKNSMVELDSDDPLIEDPNLNEKKKLSYRGCSN